MFRPAGKSRFPLVFLLFAAGLFYPGVKNHCAAALPDAPGEISLVHRPGKAAPRGSPALFGFAEKSTGDISEFLKWSDMYNRFEADIRDPLYADILQKWRAALRPLAGLPAAGMAQAVNDMMNAFPYVHNDYRLWGARDYWETPLEFLAYSGDCKDYAIAKYASLRMLGVPENRLRLTIVQDLLNKDYHAVLVLYTDNEALVLDNRRRKVLPSAMIARYRPIYSINRTTLWVYRRPDAMAETGTN
jgi:predicted transglutaminase-like cysteine proteinase